jgi:CubicO group peptidase (beta-lactamase class C family)
MLKRSTAKYSLDHIAKRIALFVLFAVMLAPAFPRNKSEATPESLDAVLEPIRLKYDLPALAGAIVTSQGLVAHGAVGVRKYRVAAPVTIDDQFHLGSDTKAMTATMLATLVEQGKLKWDVTLSDALPELAPQMDPAYRSVTLQQLLSHRAGFTAESWPIAMSIDDIRNLPGTPREQRWAYAQIILGEPPAIPPATKFLYSNRSYAIAGVVAERAMNSPWEDLMRERIFEPLGMTTCGFGAMGTPGEVDQPWQHTLFLTMHRPIGPGPRADNPPAIGPAATVHCSIGDWAKFVQAHLRGEKGLAGILAPEAFRKLHTSPYGANEYAFGWIPEDRAWGGGRVLMHAGSNTQNFAVVWLSPLRDFAVLAATNQGGDDAFHGVDDAAYAMILRFNSRR